MFKNAIINILTEINEMVASMGENAGLLETLESWNSTLNLYTQQINDAVIKPVAYTVLAALLIIELYAVSQRIAMNGGGNQYAAQQVSVSVIKMWISKLVVDYSYDVVVAVYSIFADITRGIAEFVGSGQISATMDVTALTNNLPTGIGGQLSTLISLMIAQFIIRMVTIVVTTVIAARYIELYVYTAVAPLPITTFASAELHTIGLNFLKNFAAVSLQGALIYLVIGFYPALFSGLATAESASTAAWEMCGLTVLLAIAVFTCGRWAKSIMAAS